MKHVKRMALGSALVVVSFLLVVVLDLALRWVRTWSDDVWRALAVVVAVAVATGVAYWIGYSLLGEER